MPKHGNGNWGNRLAPVPALLTEFEMTVANLRLKQSDYVTSVELKLWCGRNRNRVYVPEWLLREWRMQVELSVGAA